MRKDHAWETGFSDKPEDTQVNDAQSKDMNDYTPGSRLGDQKFTLNLERRKSGLICDNKLERRQLPKWALLREDLYKPFDNDK